MWSALIVATAASIFLLQPLTANSVTLPDEVVAQKSNEKALAEHARAIADAILIAEGRCGHGQSGEYGCYQYQPATWAAYSRQVAGEVLPHTAENEHVVTEGMIRKWLADGVSERGIFLTWNQGSATGWGPGSKDCYAGTNKWGVHYDSCDYARRALESLVLLESPSISAPTASSSVIVNRVI